MAANERIVRDKALEKTSKLIEDIDFAMLMTVDADWEFRSRPMETQQVDIQNRCLWFFTGDDTPKVFDIERDHRVHVSYASPERNRFVSVSRERPAGPR